MKNLKSTVLAALLMVSGGAMAQDVNYDISVLVPDTVKFITVTIDQNKDKVDTIKVSGTNAEVKGTARENAIVVVRGGCMALAVVNDGTHADIELASGDIAGSSENEMFGRVQREIREQESRIGPIATQWSEARKDTTEAGKAKLKELQAQLMDIQDGIFQEALKFAQGNKMYAAPAYLLNIFYSAYDFDELKTVVDSTAVYYSSPLMKPVIAMYKSYLKRAPGLKFTDLVMNDPDGKEVRLSQWTGKGQYTLVDFWASWCGPCRREMPTVVEAYNKYHAQKGFEIVGVSFDSKADAWKKGVKDLGMTWPQMSDLKGWGSAAHDVYGVNSIPSNILVDPQGVIVASDLRGEGLLKKLAEVFGE